MKVHGIIFCPKAFFQITDAPAILRNAIFLDDEFDALEYALYKWQRNIAGCYAGGELLSTNKVGTLYGFKMRWERHSWIFTIVTDFLVLE